MSAGAGRRLVLLQSARRWCDVCKGAGGLRVVALFGIPAAFATGCPHCNPDESGLTDAVEVWPLPMLDDTARTA